VGHGGSRRDPDPKEELVPDPAPPTPRARVPWTTDLVIVAAATICALVTTAITTGPGGVRLEVALGGTVQRVDVVSVVVVSALAALVGVLSLRLLELATVRALPLWTGGAIAVALVSMLGPLAGTSPAAVGTLAALHAVVATVVIVASLRSRRRRGRRAGAGTT